MLTIAVPALLLNILQSSTPTLTQSIHQIYSRRRKRQIYRISGHHDNQESKKNCKNFKSVQHQCCPQTRNDFWLHFKKPKEKSSKDVLTGVICDKVFIGQTLRALRSRTREHKRVIFTRDRNSLLINPTSSF